MDDFQLLYDNEVFSVYLPTYLADPVSTSAEESENERENGEDSEYSENTGDTSSYDLDNVVSNQVLIQEQIDNLNNNVCILNDNLIKVNNVLLFCTGVSTLLLFFTLVNFAIRIFNNTLGLGKV